MCLRRYTSLEDKETHRKAVARYFLRNGIGSKDYANKVLTSPETIKSQGTWFVIDSKVHKAITLAVVNKWKVLDLFQPEILERFQKDGPYTREDLFDESF
jgi:hypothetical protein